MPRRGPRDAALLSPPPTIVANDSPHAAVSVAVVVIAFTVCPRYIRETRPTPSSSRVAYVSAPRSSPTFSPSPSRTVTQRGHRGYTTVLCARLHGHAQPHTRAHTRRSPRARARARTARRAFINYPNSDSTSAPASSFVSLLARENRRRMAPRSRGYPSTSSRSAGPFLF